MSEVQEESKPEKAPYRIVAYKFATGVNMDFNDAAMHQLRLAHQLKNELVAIWHERRQKVADAWLTQPEVDVLSQRIEVVKEECDAAHRAWQKSKVEKRDRIGISEVKDGWTASRKQLKELRVELKEAKEKASDALKDDFQRFAQEEYLAIKDTYRRYVQETVAWDPRLEEYGERVPLTWHTYNMVLDQHKAAVARIQKNRNDGKASDLRFRRWTGEGKIAAQLQRGASAPARTPERLSRTDKDNQWRNVVRLPENSLTKQRLPIAVRLGMNDDREPILFEIPEVIWHRQIDPEADITDVKVARRQVAGSFRLWVEITAKVPLLSHPGVNGVVGIDTGWRTMPDGSIRVAVWRGGADALDVPHHLKDAIINEGEGGEVRIPKSWVDKWHFAEELRSRRDKALDIMRGDLIEAFDQIAGLAEIDDLTAGDIARWKSPARFASLAFRLRSLDSRKYPIIGQLEHWRQSDKKLWVRETGERQRVVRRRDDLFKVVANRLLNVTSEIAVEEPYVATVVQTSDEDTHQDDAGHRAWMIAAPSSLILAIKQAGLARGIKLKTYPAAGTTLIHKACGHRNPPGSGIRSVMITCENCGDKYDQDSAAAWALLEMAT